MQIKLKLSQQLLLLVIIPIAIEVILGTSLYVLLQQTGADLKREATSRQLVRKINESRSEFLWAYQVCNEYLFKHDPWLYNQFLNHSERARVSLREIGVLVKDDPTVPRGKIEKVWGDALTARESAQALLAAWDKGENFAVMRAGFSVKQCSERISEALNGLIEKQLDLQDEYAKQTSAKRMEQGRLVILLILIPSAALLAFGLTLSRSISRRFDLLIDNTKRLSAGMELNPPLGGHSELSMLDQEFRRMSTELERALRKQRAIVDYAADVICSLNSSYSFSEVSPAALAVWGYEPDELIGLRVASLVHPDDAQRTAKCLEDAETRSIESFENRIMRKNGSIVDTRWSVRYVEQEKSIVCIAHDISQRKELERMKQEFVAIVSHDLRSPLTSISLRLNTLASGMHGDLPPEAIRIITVVEGSVKRLIGLINDLLDIEKLESGSWDMRFAKQSLLETMATAKESLLALSEKKRIEIVLPQTDIDVTADHERLTQVFTNLISNAIKFSPEDSQVVVRAEAKDSMLEVSITDSGPGILEEDRALIFDRFRQSKRESESKSGSGLGLAICSAIVKEHGGTIGVDSNNGDGSTFWFRIPFSIDEKKLRQSADC